MHNKRLLFVVNIDQYFVTHRLHLAKLAIDNGFEVGLVCNVTNYKKTIESVGIKLFNWELSRGSVNLFNELKAVLQLFKLIKQFSPDIVHSVAIKSVIYSSIVFKFQSFKSICALGGLGFIFSSNKLKARLLRVVVDNSLKFLFRDSLIILQNPDDEKLLIDNNTITQEQVRLIHGAGVDIDKFLPNKNKSNTPLVILPARMLWDKGVGEFVKCAEEINKQSKKARFVLIGGVDKDNPEAVSKEQLEKWINDNVVEWWGHQEDMLKVYKQADIVCFPSYREGLPMSLLESASCGLPIVAFDVPGCREIVIDRVNGFLVKNKNQEELCYAIEKLLNDKKLRKQFGNSGRELVIKEFSQEQVRKETLQVWNEALN